MGTLTGTIREQARYDTATPTKTKRPMGYENY